MPIESKLRSETVSAIFKQPDISTRIEDLRNETNPAAFLERANNLGAELYLRQDTEIFSSFRTPLEAGVPVDDLERAVKYNYFGTIRPDNPLFYKLCEAVSAKESLTRHIIRRTLGNYNEEAENKLGLTEVERIVILGSCDISDVFDDMFVDFVKHLTEDPAEKEVRGKKPEDIKALLRIWDIDPNSSEYLYVLFEKMGDDQTIRPVPWVESRALKTHIASLREILNHIVYKLEEDPLKTSDRREAAPYIDYFSAFKAALNARHPHLQEEAWHELDEKWMQIRSRVQPIHPMETYTDDLRLRVEPAYVLAIKDERDEEMQKLHELTVKELKAWLKKRYQGKKSMEASAASMDKTLSGYYTATMSGARLAYKFGGENVPNREDIRVKDGSKIFLFIASIREGWELNKKRLTKIFGAEKVAQIYDDPENIIRMRGGIMLSGHEEMHNALVQDGTRKTIGVYEDGLVEEWKCNLGIYSATPDFSFISSKDKKDYLKALLASSIATLEARENKGRRSYYISALVVLNTLVEMGILSLKGSEWDPNFENEENNARFFEKITPIFDEMQEVYETMSGPKAKVLADKHLRETEEVKLLGKALGVDMDKPL